MGSLWVRPPSIPTLGCWLWALTPSRPSESWIRSFKIGRNTAGDTWYLYVNKKCLWESILGETAVGALFGAFMAAGASRPGAIESIEHQMSLGISEIASDENGLSLSRSGDDYEVVLSDREDSSITPANGSFVVALQFRAAGDDYLSTGSVLDASAFQQIAIDSPTSVSGSEATYVFSSAFLNQDENTFVRAVIADVVTGTYTVTNVIDARAAQGRVDDTVISFTVDVPDTLVGDFATATVTDSSVLDPREVITFDYNWYRQVPSLTVSGTEN